MALLSLLCTRLNFFDLHGDSPATVRSVITRGTRLHGERLLIMGGDTRVESPRNIFVCLRARSKTRFVFALPELRFTIHSVGRTLNTAGWRSNLRSR